MQRSLAAVGNAKLAIYAVITIALAGLIASTTYAVSQTNTPIMTTDNGGGVVVDSSGTSNVAEPTTSGPGPISRAWSNFVDWFLKVSDLQALAGEPVARTILQVTMLILGLILATFGSRTYEWLRKHQRPHSVVQASIARLGGIVLVVLAFII